MAADRLVCAIPLPVFVKRCLQADDRTREAASRLRCTSLWLVDVVAPHPRRRGFHWAYVYDESMLSTRLTHMDALSAGNAPEGSCAIQVEVYESAYRALRLDADEIRRRVVGELGRMGLIDAGTTAVSRIRRIPWANVLFDQEQSGALERIWEWAERFGLVREPMDTHPLTDWAAATPLTSPLLAFAGRYAQWKYFWTDDCILRGMQLGGRSTAPAGP
jgi:protoporphyrinogen oxidase